MVGYGHRAMSATSGKMHAASRQSLRASYVENRTAGRIGTLAKEDEGTRELKAAGGIFHEPPLS